MWVEKQWNGTRVKTDVGGEWRRTRGLGSVQSVREKKKVKLVKEAKKPREGRRRSKWLTYAPCRRQTAGVGYQVLQRDAHSLFLIMRLLL